jgi:hypothetical protein
MTMLMGAVMQCLACGADSKMLLMDVVQDDTMKVPVIERRIYMFGLQTHCTATGVQTRQNADHSFAGYSYTNARCSPQRRSPQSLGRRLRNKQQSQAVQNLPNPCRFLQPLEHSQRL